MSTREFNFTVGPETSTQPTTGTPTADGDLLTKGYADGTYVYGSAPMADITAIKAIAAADRNDGDLVLNQTTNLIYAFDAGSSATGDDDLILTPAAGTGRWIRTTQVSSLVPNLLGDEAYPVTDTDGYDSIIAGQSATLTTARTITLPTAADNINRYLHITKADSSAYAVTVDGDGVNVGVAATQVLGAQGDFIKIFCDGTAWHILAGSIASATQSGLVSTGAQTFAGVKTMTEARLLNPKITDELLATTVSDTPGAATLTLNGSSRYCIIEIGGGGGGGESTAANWYGAAGGGGGAYSEFFLDLEDANWISDNGNSTTLYYDVAAVVGGGAAGDLSTFSVATSTTIVSCAGGGAGVTQTGGTGGTVTVTAKSYIYPIKNIPGQNGGNGVGNQATSTTVAQGYGGASSFGSGGQTPHGNYTTTLEADGPRGTLGGGAAGGVRLSSSSRVYRGGQGSSGRIIIREYA